MFDNDENTERYIRNMRIGSVSAMSADEEKKLIVDAQSGDVAAFQSLVIQWLPLTVKIAIKYRNVAKEWRTEFEDLLQSAATGLMEGIQRFDVNRAGVRLSSYAYFWIVNNVRKAIWPHRSNRASGASNVSRPDELTDGIAERALAFFPDHAIEIEDADFNAFVDSKLREMDARKAEIIRRRSQGETLGSISRVLSISPERVRQIARTSEIELREALSSELVMAR